MRLLGAIDDGFQRLLGIPYLELTRSAGIHERCRYLMAALDGLPPCGSGGHVFLDVGCGSGMALRYLDRRLPAGRVSRYVGIDLRARRLEERFRDVHRIEHSFVDVDLDDEWPVDGKFDVVWCAEVLEHMTNDVGVMRKIAAHLRPGGHVILTMPSLTFVRDMGRHHPFLLETSPTQDGGHVRLGYDRAMLGTLAVSAGLELLRVDGISPLDAKGIAWRYDPTLSKVENALYALDPRKPVPFVLGDAYAGREDRFHSIGAVMRAPTG